MRNETLLEWARAALANGNADRASHYFEQCADRQTETDSTRAALYFSLAARYSEDQPTRKRKLYQQFRDLPQKAGDYMAVADLLLESGTTNAKARHVGLAQVEITESPIMYTQEIKRLTHNCVNFDDAVPALEDIEAKINFAIHMLKECAL